MAGPFFNTRVRETSVSTGVGVFQLAGAVDAFLSFLAIGDGNTCHYIIADGTQFEEGLGLFTETPPGSLNTLTRLQVFSNSDGTTTQINFGVGTKEVFISPARELLAPRTAKLLLTAAVGPIAASTPTDIVWDVDFEDPYKLHAPTVQEVFQADIGVNLDEDSVMMPGHILQGGQDALLQLIVAVIESWPFRHVHYAQRDMGELASQDRGGGLD